MSYVYVAPSKTLEIWLERIAGKKCPCCGVRGAMNKDHYSYNRGYNTLCEQAAGDRGMWCTNCRNVIWFQTDEEFERECLQGPNWCIPNFRMRQYRDSGGDESILTDLGYVILTPLRVA